MEWLPFSIVLALIIAIVMARWPVAASLGFYAFLLPFDSILIAARVGEIHLHVTWLVGAATTVVLVLTGLLGRRLLRPPQAAVFAVLIVFWAFMSYFWAINIDRAVFRLPFLALLLLLYLAGVSVRITENEVRAIAWMAIFGGVLAAAISLYAFSQGEWWRSPVATQVLRELSGRGTLSSGGRVTDPNTLGATLVLPLSLAVGFLMSSRTWPRRLLLIGSVVVIGASVLATMSRGTILGVTIVFLVFLWRSRASWRLLLPFALIGGAATTMPLVLARFAQTQADRGAGRLDIWGVGLRAFGHYAFLGAGLDCFPDAFNQYAHTAKNFVGFFRAPHNIFLGTGVELGVVGLVLLLLFIFRHIAFAVNSRRADTDEAFRLQLVSFEAGLWGLVVCGLFIDLFWEGYFWLSLMLLTILVRARQESREAAYEAFDRFAPSPAFEIPTNRFIRP
ncbi:MAG: O-antigen ligase family protein [Terriglobales bacterium]